MICRSEAFQLFLLWDWEHRSQGVRTASGWDLCTFSLCWSRGCCIVLNDIWVEFFLLLVLRFQFRVSCIELYSLLILVFRRFLFLQDRIQSYLALHEVSSEFYFKLGYFPCLHRVYCIFLWVCNIDYGWSWLVMRFPSCWQVGCYLCIFWTFPLVVGIVLRWQYLYSYSHR